MDASACLGQSSSLFLGRRVLYRISRRYLQGSTDVEVLWLW
jgi:hypothetical protein